MKHAIPYHFLVDGCVGYNYGLDASAAAEHRWYYFPALAANEVIVFKAYDSEGPSWCFHAACDDPTAPEGCVPRDVALARVEVLHADLRVEDHVTDEKREPPVDLHQLQLANGVSGILLNFNYISY